MGFRQRPSWHADAVRGAVHPIIPERRLKTVRRSRKLSDRRRHGSATFVFAIVLGASATPSCSLITIFDFRSSRQSRRRRSRTAPRAGIASRRWLRRFLADKELEAADAAIALRPLREAPTQRLAYVRNGRRRRRTKTRCRECSATAQPGGSAEVSREYRNLGLNG